MKTVLCFGDSNTYGLMPDSVGRYPREIRWTGRLQEMYAPSDFLIMVFVMVSEAVT